MAPKKKANNNNNNNVNSNNSAKKLDNVNTSKPAATTAEIPSLDESSPMLIPGERVPTWSAETDGEITESNCPIPIEKNNTSSFPATSSTPTTQRDNAKNSNCIQTANTDFAGLISCCLNNRCSSGQDNNDKCDKGGGDDGDDDAGYLPVGAEDAARAKVISNAVSLIVVLVISWLVVSTWWMIERFFTPLLAATVVSIAIKDPYANSPLQTLVGARKKLEELGLIIKNTDGGCGAAATPTTTTTSSPTSPNHVGDQQGALKVYFDEFENCKDKTKKLEATAVVLMRAKNWFSHNETLRRAFPSTLLYLITPWVAVPVFFAIKIFGYGLHCDHCKTSSTVKFLGIDKWVFLPYFEQLPYSFKNLFGFLVIAATTARLGDFAVDDFKLAFFISIGVHLAIPLVVCVLAVLYRVVFFASASYEKMVNRQIKQLRKQLKRLQEAYHLNHQNSSKPLTASTRFSRTWSTSERQFSNESINNNNNTTLQRSNSIGSATLQQESSAELIRDKSDIFERQKTDDNINNGIDDDAEVADSFEESLKQEISFIRAVQIFSRVLSVLLVLGLFTTAIVIEFRDSSQSAVKAVQDLGIAIPNNTPELVLNAIVSSNTSTRLLQAVGDVKFNYTWDSMLQAAIQFYNDHGDAVTAAIEEAQPAARISGLVVGKIGSFVVMLLGWIINKFTECVLFFSTLFALSALERTVLYYFLLKILRLLSANKKNKEADAVAQSTEARVIQELSNVFSGVLHVFVFYFLAALFSYSVFSLDIPMTVSMSTLCGFLTIFNLKISPMFYLLAIAAIVMWARGGEFKWGMIVTGGALLVASWFIPFYRNDRAKSVQEALENTAKIANPSTDNDNNNNNNNTTPISLVEKSNSGDTMTKKQQEDAALLRQVQQEQLRKLKECDPDAIAREKVSSYLVTTSILLGLYSQGAVGIFSGPTLSIAARTLWEAL